MAKQTRYGQVRRPEQINPEISDLATEIKCTSSDLITFSHPFRILRRLSGSYILTHRSGVSVISRTTSFILTPFPHGILDENPIPGRRNAMGGMQYKAWLAGHGCAVFGSWLWVWGSGCGIGDVTRDGFKGLFTNSSFISQMFPTTKIECSACLLDPALYLSSMQLASRGESCLPAVDQISYALCIF